MGCAAVCKRGGWRNSPFCWRLGFTLALPVPPHFFGLAQRNGVEPQRKALLGGGAPVRFRDPPASPTRVGAATRPLRCPLRGRIGSLAPRARGLGWRKSRPVKVFCPAFLQKSGRGPGAEPMAARRSARNSPFASQSAGGGQRGNPRRGFPLCGRLKPPAARATPRVRRWTKKRVVGDADPYGLRRGRAACRWIYRVRDAAWELVKTPPPAAF